MRSLTDLQAMNGPSVTCDECARTGDTYRVNLCAACAAAPANPGVKAWIKRWNALAKEAIEAGHAFGDNRATTIRDVLTDFLHQSSLTKQTWEDATCRWCGKPIRRSAPGTLGENWTHLDAAGLFISRDCYPPECGAEPVPDA